MDQVGKEDPLALLVQREKKEIWVHLEQLGLLELEVPQVILDLRDHLENPAQLDPQVPLAPLQRLWRTFLEQTSTLMSNSSQRNLHLPRQSLTGMRQGPIMDLMQFGSTVRFTCL